MVHVIKKNRVVPYTPAQIYALVNDVDHYPQFLQWCERTKLTTIAPTVVEATLWINYLTVRHHFTTRNTLKPDSVITMKLVDGPFSELEGEWRFEPAPHKSCHIVFQLRYAFNASLLNTLLSPIFYAITNTMVASFAHEADRLFAVPKDN